MPILDMAITTGFTWRSYFAQNLPAALRLPAQRGAAHDALIDPQAVMIKLRHVRSD